MIDPEQVMIIAMPDAHPMSDPGRIMIVQADGHAVDVDRRADIIIHVLRLEIIGDPAGHGSRPCLGGRGKYQAGRQCQSETDEGLRSTHAEQCAGRTSYRVSFGFCQETTPVPTARPWSAPILAACRSARHRPQAWPHAG